MLGGLLTPALAVFPFGGPPGPDVYDYASYMFIGNGDCSGADNDLPPDFDCTNDWKFTDKRDTSDPLVASNPQEFYGVRGVGTNKAWEVSTGRPDVVIAVLDSGIRWEENRPELVDKYYVNRFELPLPGGIATPNDRRFGGYDRNGDGAFNPADYVGDERVSDLNGNGAIDPEDLIRTFSDGTDADANGYVDDISGWDFFEGDNNPQDDTDYGHGTGEAEDSTGEAGEGSDGQCPNCMMMPMRVGDSFIADVNHWAEAVYYAVDNGAAVVQEALGTLNHTSFGQAAADHAYRNGVIINASAADEAAGHHNWPAAYDHTMVVNSIRTSGLERLGRPNSYLYFNGCTNFGGYIHTAIPSTSCSSEATGRSSGVSGLLQSAARNAVETGAMTNYISDDGATTPFALSTEEMMQLWRLASDDIDFSSPCPGPNEHAFCDDAPEGVTPAAVANDYGTTIPASARYQSVAGWDYFFGYGRNNAARLLRYIGRDGEREYVAPGLYGVGDHNLRAQDRIPPEADISSPRRWRQYAVGGDGRLLNPDDRRAPTSIVVRGRVAANRVTLEGGTFDWVLEWAPHVQGQRWPVRRPADGSEERSDGPWTVVSSGQGLTHALEGELGRIDVRRVAEALQTNSNPFDPATDPTSEFQPERFALRLRLRVLAHPAVAGDDVNNEAVTQKQVDVYPATEYVIRDDVGIGGQPSGGAGAPSFHDVNGDGRDELLLPTEDGLVHAFTDVARARELPGWPVRTDPYPGPHTGDVSGSILAGTVMAADVDDDGVLEVGAADLEGKLYLWEPDGTRRPGFPVSVDRSLSQQSACGPATIPNCDDYETGPPRRNEHNDRDWGINSPPVAGDIDRDYPGLELLASSNDGHVYAWHADGSPVNGWPVILRDPAKVAAMDPTTRFITYVEGAEAERGTKVLPPPALGDIDRDGDLEIVAGVNEEYIERPNADVTTDPLTAAIGESGLADPGNTRLYVLHHDGSAHPESDATQSTPHTQDQAYAPGWPVPIAMLLTDLLPYVGEGADMQPALANFDGDPEMEIAFASATGPGYLLNHDGTSMLGEGPTGYRTLQSVHANAASEAQDTPSLVAVGGFATGSLDGGAHLSLAGPGVGLRRALDILLPAQQLGAQDHLLMWNTLNGALEPTAPIVLNDLQFFVQPIIADITGEGIAEVVQGTAVSDTVVAGLYSTSTTATRHHTGGWTVAPAAVGDAGGGRLSLATVTREGYLRLYRTSVPSNSAAACAALGEWPEGGHDARNTSNYETDAVRPSPVRDIKLDAGVVTFTAPGDDRNCGKVKRYEVRLGVNWSTGVKLKISLRATVNAGEIQSLSLPTLPAGTSTLLVRAFDDAGNGSPVVAARAVVPRVIP